MSLISAKNFIAPLQNKVHLGTIILVAVCFAFLRGAGASFSTYSKGYSTEPKRAPVSAQRYAPTSRSAGQQKNTYGYKDSRDTQSARPARRNNAEKQNTQQQSGNLFDLEQELGLK
ncbi:MAG: hypothetical protein KDD62_06265 [Bdellovibrionales bacterium]|nr:hypothetical protein [Bdellovibrionales bacterium]